jgi:hypothetical protein
MRHLIIISIASLFLGNCGDTTSKKIPTDNQNELKTLESDSVATEFRWHYKEVHQSHADSLLLDICSIQGVEFIDFYPVLDSISSDKNERLILVDSLKSIGFNVTNWGRGNWMEGPRIVNFTMSNQQCECQVDKLYYSTGQEDLYRVTERIRCTNVNK